MTVARLLLTNDDGVNAPGLIELANALEGARTARGSISCTVVAPLYEQSGCGQALTLFRPLRANQVREGWYSVDGTPSDCVNVAFHALLEEPPDLLVSGINMGVNLGDDVTHSGTVGAVLEGRLLGLPAVAFSQEYRKVRRADMGRAAARAARMVAALVDHGIPDRMLLNVNLPYEPPRGARVARLGRRPYRNTVVEQADPRGGAMYWIVGTPDPEDRNDTDAAAVRDGLISITPLTLDLTDHGLMADDGGLLESLVNAMASDTAAAPGAGTLAP